MPGPVSDSYDPEFGTGANADIVREAIETLKTTVTNCIGDSKLQYIVDVCKKDDYDDRRGLHLTERELRIIRFCLNRALEDI